MRLTVHVDDLAQTFEDTDLDQLLQAARAVATELRDELREGKHELAGRKQRWWLRATGLLRQQPRLQGSVAKQLATMRGSWVWTMHTQSRNTTTNGLLEKEKCVQRQLAKAVKLAQSTRER